MRRLAARRWNLSLTVLAIAVASAGLALALLSAISACLYYSKLRVPHVQRPGTVTLLMAVTLASSSRLRALLEALDRQTLSPRRLLIAVESPEDPAYEAAMRLSAEHWSFDTEVVIAGLAVSCSQKARNLEEAIQRIDDLDDAIVLLDADVLPPRWWLSALVSPLFSGDSDLVTGYRWPTLERWTAGGFLIAAIDRTISILPRPRPAALAWGGSLAISRNAHRQLILARILGCTLSDDLSIAASASALGLRILNRRALLVPTPTHYSMSAAWSFARRQYSILRIYRPPLWYMALAGTGILLAAWAVILYRLPESHLARTALALLAACAFVKVWTLDRIAARLECTDSYGTRLLQFALISVKPLVDAFHFSAVVASWCPRALTWGHVTYRVEGPHRIAVLERRAWPRC